MRKTKALILNNRKAVFLALMSVIALSVVVYIFSINFTVRNIASRQKIERDLSYLNMRINEMEFQYIKGKNEITLEKAIELGFVKTQNTKFVSRTRAVAIAEVSSNTR